MKWDMGSEQLMLERQLPWNGSNSGSSTLYYNHGNSDDDDDDNDEDNRESTFIELLLCARPHSKRLHTNM